MSDIAGISNPYLSQIERGLRRPSAEILQKIAKALRLSAETFYVRAGILDDERASNLESAILATPDLTDEARHALITVYRSLRTPRTGSDEGEAAQARGESQPA
ncbi:MAG: helix-turn-helix domain-containing protein [Acidimicrobiales bacterium]